MLRHSLERNFILLKKNLTVSAKKIIATFAKNKNIIKLFFKLFLSPSIILFSSISFIWFFFAKKQLQKNPLRFQSPTTHYCLMQWLSSLFLPPSLPPSLPPTPSLTPLSRSLFSPAVEEEYQQLHQQLTEKETEAADLRVAVDRLVLEAEQLNSKLAELVKKGVEATKVVESYPDKIAVMEQRLTAIDELLCWSVPGTLVDQLSCFVSDWFTQSSPQLSLCTSAMYSVRVPLTSNYYYYSPHKYY